MISLRVNNWLPMLAAVMHRLRCGIIYTNAFAAYLATLSQRQPLSRASRILCLEYLRAGTGPQRGSAWWKIDWLPAHRAPEDCCFTIGTVAVCLSRQSQRGLRDRCLDWRDGQVVIRS